MFPEGHVSINSVWLISQFGNIFSKNIVICYLFVMKWKSTNQNYRKNSIKLPENP